MFILVRSISSKSGLNVYTQLLMGCLHLSVYRILLNCTRKLSGEKHISVHAGSSILRLFIYFMFAHPHRAENP